MKPEDLLFGRRIRQNHALEHATITVLSGYVPDLIEEDFAGVVNRAMAARGQDVASVTDWCIHPGGKRILEAIQKSAGLTDGALDCSYKVLSQYGNLSSATILFVLKEQLRRFSTRVVCIRLLVGEEVERGRLERIRKDFAETFVDVLAV